MKNGLKIKCHVLEETHFAKEFRFFAGMVLIVFLGLITACETLNKINDPQYKEFETAATNILQSSAEAKIQEIDIFLQKWGKYKKDNWYQKVLMRRKDLVKCAEDSLISDLTGTEEKPALSAKENVRRAKARKHAYEKAMKQYTVGDNRWKELSAQANKAESNRIDWERYLKLEEFYQKVCNASAQEKLKLCNDFLTQGDWTLDNFPKKENYFKEIKKQAQELKLKLLRQLSLSEKKPADVNDFQAMKEYYENRSKALNDYISYFPESSAEFTVRKDEMKTAEREKEKYARWCKLVEKAVSIIAEDKRPNKKIKNILSDIQSFFKEFPVDQYKCLKDYYTQIKDIQKKAAMEICIKIDCAIEQNQQKDDLSKLPDVYEANAKIIEENLIHLTGTDFYGRYERKQFRFYQEATKLREENDFHANHDR